MNAIDVASVTLSVLDGEEATRHILLSLANTMATCAPNAPSCSKVEAMSKVYVQ